MTSFIYTPKGYVNLNSIQMAQSGQTNWRKLITNDGVVVDDNHPDFGITITSVTPVTDEWECFTPCGGDEAGTYTAECEPVLAWGLTVLGDLIPITPSEMSGVEGYYALRKVGTAPVYSRYGQYKTPEEWVDSVTETEPAAKTGT